ncbi:MAG: PepSY domain-containing protein [Acidimicrobiales bacterium]
MTALTYADGGSAATPVRTSAAEEASRRWRSIWRLHFYAGMISMPFILLMALTGLVILYTQPIEDLTQGDIRTVEPAGEMISLDQQEANVEAAYPDGTVLDVTPPGDTDRATRFFVDDGSVNGMHVFVNPYSGEITGEVKPSSGIIGLSNRLHGYLNNDTRMISLPTISALWDDGPVWRDYVIGDLILEVLGVWTLVLMASGLYLWWPRKSAASEGSHGRRRLFSVRWNTKGRAKWRDLHGLAGVLMMVMLLVTIVSGEAWSTYWSQNFNSFADKVSPGEPVDQPNSTSRVRGDLDRFGNQIPWASGDYPIPASYAPAALDGSTAAPLSLDAVAKVAVEEGMKPGYTISFPANETDEAGNPVYGSFALYNSWPRKTGEAREVFVDQFTGEKLAEQSVYGWGAVARGMDTLVSTHMGTQLGIFSRILMTALCVLAIWSVISAFVMYWKRRRPGSAGLPRRPRDVHLSKRLVWIAVVIGIIYPQWAVSALIVLGLDKFVIHRVRPLKRAFGQA